jgi:hypothetical protein
LLTFSLEGGELQPQGSIFDCDGLVTAQQESDESKDKQEKGWHVTPIVHPQFIPSQSATSGRNNGERQDRDLEVPFVAKSASAWFWHLNQY